MNKLNTALEQIMDLEYGEVLRTEVSRKLTNTIMLVNGVLFYITEFIFTDGVVIGYSLESLRSDKSITVRVSTLYVFIPEAGLYVTDKGSYLYISKIPKKQWYKSFNENAYNVTNLAIPYRSCGWQDVLSITSIHKKDIILTKSGNIFYHDLHIGSKFGNKLLCNNSLFKQELIDWIRDARK
jgi:hypothetical protein